jgi:primosomal protein N' (replication factor Y)
MSLYAEVVLGLPLTKTFTYVIPETSKALAQIGSRVLVPFHRREITGFVVGLKSRKKKEDYELKDIREVLDEKPVFTGEFLSFTQKFSAASFCSWGEMLQAALPPSYVPKSRVKMSLSEEGEKVLQSKSLTEIETEILELLRNRAYTRTFIKRKIKQKNLSSILARLERKGLILAQSDLKKIHRRVENEADLTPVQLEMDFSLDEESFRASSIISESLGKKMFWSFYLHASRQKREAIYFDLIKKILNIRKKILFLVPEIRLTASLQEKFTKKLGENVALFHSQLTAKQRESEWERIKTSRADVVVGPRSAILSPLSNIGLIILDDEHDDSYLQTENPSYDARKGALLRAKQSSALLISGSSIPSVEAYYLAKKQGYLVEIKEKSPDRKVEILRRRSRKCVVEDKLIHEIGQKLSGKNPDPIIVFFNRRGYSSFMICSHCRYIPRCERCDVTMSFHKKKEKLLCHYCGFSSPKINTCPECGGELVFGKSFGIEVVEEEFKRRFPGKNIVCFDSDRVRTRKDQEKILYRFAEKKIDILLGTQFLAHQGNLTPVSTVVILYPEIFLTLPDFRASQKTFQTVNQMTKFLAKEGAPRLFIQTTNPDHYSIRHAAFDDYCSFYDQEIKYRRLMNYPPFSSLAEVLLTGENLRALARESRKIFSCVKDQDSQIETWGPALAPVSMIRGKFRVQVVLKSKKKRALDRALKKSLNRVKSRKTVFIYG